MEEVHTCCAEIHVIRVCLLSQSASEKVKKKAHKPLRTYRISQTFRMFSLCDLRFVLRSLDVLRAQRIMGFFIFNTHKSTVSKSDHKYEFCTILF